MSNDPKDALEALRRSDPAKWLTEPSDPVRDTEQLNRIMAMKRDPAPGGDHVIVDLAEQRKKRRSRIVGPLVLGTVLLPTVAWAYLHRKNAADPVKVLCLNQARTFEMQDDPNRPLQGALVEFTNDPITSCSAAWNGLFDQPAQQAPPLVPCVLPSGVLAVLPIDSSAGCETLRLPRWTGRFNDDPEKVKALADGLIGWNQTHPCPTGSEAGDEAATQVASAQLPSWKVRHTELSTATTACAGFLFDFSNRTIDVTFRPK